MHSFFGPLLIICWRLYAGAQMDNAQMADGLLCKVFAVCIMETEWYQPVLSVFNKGGAVCCLLPAGQRNPLHTMVLQSLCFSEGHTPETHHLGKVVHQQRSIPAPAVHLVLPMVHPKVDHISRVLHRIKKTSNA